MKKTIALFLAIALVLSAAAALSETDISGLWYADLGGVTAELTLNADGSYHLAVPLEEEKTGTWKLDDGFVYFDGANTPGLATWDESTMILGDFAGAFTREKPRFYTTADVITDAPVSLFAGLWRSAYTVQDGAALPAGYSDDNTLIYIEETRALLKGGPFGYRIVDLTLENGALVFSDDEISVRLEMQQDAFLRLTVEREGLSEVRIMARTEIDEPDTDDGE